MKRRLINFALITVLSAFGDWGCASADPVTDDAEPEQLTQALGRPKPSVVLVHGAWADALGWKKVIDLLLDDGYSVTAVENPLTSLSEDIATTRRAIERVASSGPVVLVGHSFGGAAITGAASGNAKVKALVYINAFAPDFGESVGQLAASYPSALDTALLPDASGYLFIDPEKFHDVFCADVPTREARVLAASQKPVFGAAFAEPMTAPAWRSLPTYYLVGSRDQAIPAESQRFMAKRMGAHTVEVDSSHAAFISHPRAVVELIEQAARSVAGRRAND